MPPDLNVSAFKLHLVHIHPMRAFFPEEDKMELATKTALFINGRELVDERVLGGDMENKTTGQNLYPNKITIQIRGRDPPTMTSDERTKLMKECEEADFKQPNNNEENKEKTRTIPKSPCIYVIPGKPGSGHHGILILVLSGENLPLALLFSNYLLTGSLRSTMGRNIAIRTKLTCSAKNVRLTT